ncbi:MAG: ATP-binding protein [Dehalococcoidales bacterium]|nr:ATP-binding protein [Dehalococcoidales bacterium]
MIISVASGKGGTGKTLVSTSLALSLKDNQKIQLLDCDVEEPNDYILLKPVMTGSEPVNMLVPVIDEEKCTHCGKCAKICAYHALAVLTDRVMTFLELCHSCGACSYLCPEEAISEEPRQTGVLEWGDAKGISFIHGILNVGEAMAPPVIRKVKERFPYDGISIRDVSPGTSCPVVESIKGSDFCLLVTEPTPFGLNDLILAVEMVRKLEIPCGVVLNRAGVGDAGVEEYCRKEKIPILLTIPLDTDIAHLYSRGIPLAEGMPQWKNNFIHLFNSIKEIVDARNHSLKR